MRNGRNLITTEDYPKTIVHDFQAYLDYISQNKVKLTKARAYITRKDLKGIYEILQDKNPVPPEKGNQDSYLPIHLFYHLALALDLTRKKASKSGTILQSNDERIAAYKQLNSAEQYATLLDAFWTKTDWEELQRDHIGKRIYNMDFLLEELEQRRFGVTIEIDRSDHLYNMLDRYEYFLYYLAYFGLWEVEVGIKTYDYTKYRVAKSLKLTSLLQKLIPILLDTWQPNEEDGMTELLSIFGIEDHGEMEEDDIKELSLFPLMQRLFEKGKLKNTLPKPELEKLTKGNFTFKVELGPACWRKLQIPGAATLLDLHDLIQKAFEFDDDHLYSFYMDGKRFSKHAYKSPMDISGPYVHEIEIGRLQLYEGKRFLYLFDYGYEWLLDVIVEEIAEEETEEKAAIVEMVGEAPEQY